jgi:hypothetical protein
VAVRFAEAVLPKAKIRILGAIVHDKEPLAPHKRGACRARAHPYFNARTGPDKGTVAKTACKKSSSFAMFCQVPNLQISYGSHAIPTWLGSPASELDQPYVPRLRPAVAFWPY